MTWAETSTVASLADDYPESWTWWQSEDTLSGGMIPKEMLNEYGDPPMNRVGLYLPQLQVKIQDESVGLAQRQLLLLEIPCDLRHDPWFVSRAELSELGT